MSYFSAVPNVRVFFFVVSALLFCQVSRADQPGIEAKKAQLYQNSTTQTVEIADRRLIDKYNEYKIEYPQYSAEQRAQKLKDDYQGYLNSARDQIACINDGKCEGIAYNFVDGVGDLIGKAAPWAPGLAKSITGYVKSEYLDSWSQRNAREYLDNTRTIGFKEASYADVSRELDNMGDLDPQFKTAYNQLRSTFAPQSKFKLGLNTAEVEASLPADQAQKLNEILAQIKAMQTGPQGGVDQKKLADLINEKVRQVLQVTSQSEKNVLNAQGNLVRGLLEAIGQVKDQDVQSELRTRLQITGLQGVLQDIQANEAQGQAKVLATLKPVVDYVRRQEVKERIEALQALRQRAYSEQVGRINEFESGVRIFSAVLGTQDPQKAEKIAALGSIIGNLARAQTAFNMEMGGIGAAALTGNYLMAGIQIMSMLKSSKSEDPTEALFKALQQVSRQIQDLRTEMNQRFDVVDRKLDRMLETMAAEFKRVDGRLDILQAQGNQIFDGLEKLRFHQAVYQKEILDAMAANLRSKINICSRGLGSSTIVLSKAERTDCFMNFANWSLEISKGSPFVRAYAGNSAGFETLGWFNFDKANNLDERIAVSAGQLGFLADFLRQEFGAGGIEPAPNLVEWLRGYRLATYVKVKYPDSIDPDSYAELQSQAIAMAKSLRALKKTDVLFKLMDQLAKDRDELRGDLQSLGREQFKTDMNPSVTSDLFLTANFSALPYAIRNCSTYAGVQSGTSYEQQAIKNVKGSLNGYLQTAWDNGYLPMWQKWLVATGFVRWEPCFYVIDVRAFTADAYRTFASKNPGQIGTQSWRSGQVAIGMKNLFFYTDKFKQAVVASLDPSAENTAPMGKLAADLRKALQGSADKFNAVMNSPINEVPAGTPAPGGFVAYTPLETMVSMFCSPATTILPGQKPFPIAAAVWLKNRPGYKEAFVKAFSSWFTVDAGFVASQLPSILEKMEFSPDSCGKYIYNQLPVHPYSSPIPIVRNAVNAVDLEGLYFKLREHYDYQLRVAALSTAQSVVSGKAGSAGINSKPQALQQKIGEGMARYEVKVRATQMLFYLLYAREMPRNDVLYALLNDGRGLGSVYSMREIDPAAFKNRAVSIRYVDPKFMEFQPADPFFSQQVRVPMAMKGAVSDDVLWAKLTKEFTKDQPFLSDWGVGQKILRERLVQLRADDRETLPIPLLDAEAYANGSVVSN